MKATLISICPFPIAEFKPGIYPGFFEIPGSKNEVPEVLVIGDSIYHVEINENNTITVRCSADTLAQSIVSDYVISNIAYSEENEACPGVSWVEGEHTSTSILTKYSDLISQLRVRQRNWFVELVKMADDDWEKTRQHKFISDTQRYAAKSMKLQRPWIITAENSAGFMKCLACQTLISTEAIICPSCRFIVDNEKYSKLKFAEVR